MQRISRSLRSIYPITDDSMEQLCAIARAMELPRRHLLIEKGLRCGHVYFIERGLSRSFCHIGSAELSSWFSAEGDITFAMNELYHDIAGFESVELLEDSLLYAIAIPEFNQLIEQNIEFCNWSRLIHQEHILRVQQARIDQISLSTEARYRKFVREQPELLQRIKLGHLASYLGMTAQNLSRLRASI